MAAWELALVLVAITFMVVNMVNLVVQIVLLTKMSGMFTKSWKLMEKVLDKSEKAIEEFFDEDL